MIDGRQLLPLGAGIALAAGMASAGSWDSFAQVCLTPVAQFQPPVTAALREIANDGRNPEEFWFAQDEERIFRIVFFSDGAARRCALHATGHAGVDLEVTGRDRLRALGATPDYEVSDSADLPGYLLSTGWREPRLAVGIHLRDGVSVAEVLETDHEG